MTVISHDADKLLAFLKVKNDLVDMGVQGIFDLDSMSGAIRHLLSDNLEVRAQLAFDAIEDARDLVRREGDVVPAEVLPAHSLLLDLVDTGDLPNNPAEVRQNLIEGVGEPWADNDRFYYWADQLARYAGRFSVMVQRQQLPYFAGYDGPLQMSLRQLGERAKKLELPTHRLREFAAETLASR